MDSKKRMTYEEFLCQAKIPRTHFDGFDLGNQLTDHFCDIPLEYDGLPFTLESSNFWSLFASYCRETMDQQGINSSQQRLKILVVHGGPCGITLDLVKNLTNVDFYHTDSNPDLLAPFNALLKGNFITWDQRKEGIIHDKQYFYLEEPLSETLIKNKNSLVSGLVDYSNLPESFSGFDVVVGEFRSFDRIPDFLQVQQRVKEDGIMIVATCKGFVDKTCFKGYFMSSRKDVNHLILETINKRQFIPTEFSCAQMSILKTLPVRLSKNAMKDRLETVYYERKDILDSYREFHFQDGPYGFGNFPENMASFCLNTASNLNVTLDSALDAGCGPGRTALELSYHFKYVEAYDFSEGFVKMLKDEVAERQLKNVRAYQGDAHMQKAKAFKKKFNLIFGCNLIDRLIDPTEWLLQSQDMVAPGGLLIVASPYTWLLEYSHISSWIGGKVVDGVPLSTRDELKRILSGLDVVDEDHRAFCIPNLDGTFQATTSRIIVFRKRNNKVTSELE